MAKKTETAIELDKIDLQLMEVTIIGDAPLIVHAWSEKARREMLDKQMKKAATGKAAKDPARDFEESMYRFGDGGYGFPSVGFKSSAVTAVTSVAGMTKIAARQSFHVIGEEIDTPGAFEGSLTTTNLVRILGGDPRMREDMVRVGMGTADIRYRAEFWPWHAALLVRYNRAALSEEQLLGLFNLAGFAVGVGEWRPERDGQNGRFRVATAADIKAVKEAA